MPLSFFGRSLLVSVLFIAASILHAQPMDATPAPKPAASTSALVQANTQFAFDLYRALHPPEGENVFFSPYSISTALAMTWAGAHGNTAAEMAKTLHWNGLPSDSVTPEFHALQQSLATAQKIAGANLSVANSLWPEQNPEAPFRPEYLAQIQANFGSAIFPVDFKTQAPAAAAKINQWVEDNTNQKIKNLIHAEDLDTKTRLVLVNAIYFKGSWASPFTPRLTKPDQFTLADGRTTPVLLMQNGYLPYENRYANITDGPVPCQLLELPYFDSQEYRHPSPAGTGPGFSLLVILPRAAGDLAKLEQALTPALFADWTNRLQGARVRVFIPKFKTEERFLLADTLKTLGIQDAFVYGPADFSGMDGTRLLYISRVIHQSFINVDENGTEAAAATAVAMAAGAAPPSQPPELFRADHPFLYFIRENATGSILFMGRLASPPAL